MHALDVTSIQAEVLLLTLQIFPQFESFSKDEDMERSFSRVGCTEIHFPFVLIIIIANFILSCSLWGHIGFSLLVKMDSSRVERIHSC